MQFLFVDLKEVMAGMGGKISHAIAGSACVDLLTVYTHHVPVNYKVEGKLDGWERKRCAEHKRVYIYIYIYVCVCVMHILILI